MFDENPNLIQDPIEPSWEQPTPLVLIHDGGGTIFSYYCLGLIDRPMYGIWNPYFEKEGSFGSLNEMARTYLDFIKSVHPSGKIIIGGWSLGGLVSLEIASILAKESNPELDLLGIVMVDSICPLKMHVQAQPIVQHAMEWSHNTKDETRRLVGKCFTEATALVNKWTLPAFEKDPSSFKKSPPPPVMLLKAREAVPITGEGISRVDVHRKDSQLGWGLYRPDLIKRVLDIPGHHFNIFTSEERAEAATEQLKVACAEIESMASASRWT